MEHIKSVWTCFAGYMIAMLIWEAYTKWSEARKKKSNPKRDEVDISEREIIDAFLEHLVYIRNHKDAVRVGDKVRLVTTGQEMYVFGPAPNGYLLCILHDHQHCQLKTVSMQLLQKVSDGSNGSDDRTTEARHE